MNVSCLIRYLTTLKKHKEKEQEIMKKVPGWNVDESVYHSKTLWTPAIALLV
jgi:hypothetical protein